MQACSTSVGGALLECLSFCWLQEVTFQLRCVLPLGTRSRWSRARRRFVFVGVDRNLDFVLRVLKENYALKDRGRLGSGDHDKREVGMLGRKIRWHKWGLSWDGDERHRKMVICFWHGREFQKVDEKRIQG